MRTVQQCYRQCLETLRRDKPSKVGDEALVEFIHLLFYRSIEDDIKEKSKDKTAKKYIYNIETGGQKFNAMIYGKFYEYTQNCSEPQITPEYQLIFNRLSKTEEYGSLFKGYRHKIGKDEVLHELIEIVKDIVFDEDHMDELGKLYEDLFNKSIVGVETGMRSANGQFFTPELIVGKLIDLIKPKIKKGEIERFMDPAFGTGGLIQETIKRYTTKPKKK